MSAVKAFFATVFAVIHMFLSVAGVIDIGEPDIKYGGTPHVEKVITEWLTLVDKGESSYIILYGDDASESEKNAAKELQAYLEKISGLKIGTYSDSIKMKIKTEICIGKTNREGFEYDTVDRKALGKEGFTMFVSDKRLVIAGGGDRGTLYGVYDFLETQLGCRWFTPTLEVLKKTETVKIDKNLNETQKPVFEYRDDYISVAWNAEWKVKQKLNGGGHDVASISKDYGSDIKYAYFEHSFRYLIPDSLFETNPEYFSYREDKGTRTTDQRCLTNPDVLRIAIEAVDRKLQECPDANIISVTQNDNSDYCQCEKCKESDEYYGAPSGTMIWFVNEVAKALEPKYPDVAFDTFAYQYTRKAPINIKPRDSVIVRLCSIECCYAHPLSECGHERTESLGDRVKDIESSYAKDMSDWAKICDRLYVWNYETNFLHYLQPYPDFHVISANMNFFAQNSVKGVFCQGTCSTDIGGEFEELRAYLLAKVMWDPDTDVEFHMDEFLNAYYGEKSAPFIKEYLEKLTNKYVKTEHMFTFDWHYQGVILMPSEIKQFDKLWQNAIDNAKDETQKNNILRSQLSYRFYKANLFLGEFNILRVFGRVYENKKLYDDVVKFKITRVNPYEDLNPDPNFFNRPISW